VIFPGQVEKDWQCPQELESLSLGRRWSPEQSGGGWETLGLGGLFRGGGQSYLCPGGS
jgi:hypothetical protein